MFLQKASRQLHTTGTSVNPYHFVISKNIDSSFTVVIYDNLFRLSNFLQFSEDTNINTYKIMVHIFCYKYLICTL